MAKYRPSYLTMDKKSLTLKGKVYGNRNFAM